MHISVNDNFTVMLECNNNCVFCLRSKIKNTSKISNRDIMRSIKNYRHKSPNITLSGGEATASSTLFKIIKLCRGVSFERINLLTNARMCSYNKFVKAISESGVAGVGVSIYSTSEKNHDAITRVKGSCRQTMRGIKNLISLIDNVWANITISKFNYKDIRKTIRDLYELGIRYFVISDIISTEGDFHYSHNELKRYIKNVLQIDYYPNAEFIIKGYPFCLFKDIIVSDSDLELYASKEKKARLETFRLNDAINILNGIVQNDTDRITYLNELNNTFTKTIECSRCRLNYYCQGFQRIAIDQFKSTGGQNYQKFIPELLINPTLSQTSQRLKELGFYLADQYNTVLTSSVCKKRGRCKHCFEEQMPPGLQICRIYNLPFQIIRKSINLLDPKKREVDVGFMHERGVSGETFDQSNIIEILKLIRKKCPNSIINILTCGAFLTLENIKIMEKIGNIHFAIHVVSSDLKTQDSQMPGGTVNVLKNLRYLSKNSNFKFSFNFVAIPHKFGWHQVRKSILELDGYGPLSFNMDLYSYTQYTRKDEIPRKGYFNEYIDFCEDVRNKINANLLCYPEAVSGRVCLINSPFFSAFKKIIKSIDRNKNYLVLVSEVVYPAAQTLFNKYVNVKVKIARNYSFGGNVIVGGLLSCSDYIAAIKSKSQKFDTVFISGAAFNKVGNDLFGMNSNLIEALTGTKVKVINDDERYMWKGYEKHPTVAIQLATSKSRYLEQAINSVLAQHFRNFLLLIMVDTVSTSPKETGKINKILERYSSNRQVKIIYYDGEKGIGNIRREMIRVTDNLGIKYFCVLDDDDLLDNFALKELTMKIEENPQFSIIRTGIAYLDKNDNVKEFKGAVKDRQAQYGMTCDVLNVGHLYCVNLGKYKKTAGLESFKEFNHIGHDIDLFLKMEEAGKIISINKILYYKRDFLKNSNLNKHSDEELERIAYKYAQKAIARRKLNLSITKNKDNDKRNFAFTYKQKKAAIYSKDSLTGTSLNLLDAFAVRQIKKVDPKSIVDFGAGKGKYALLVKRRINNSIKITGVEIYTPLYKILAAQKNYNKLFNCDLKRWLDGNKNKYDLAIFGDVLEHFRKNEISAILNKATSKFRHILVVAPLGVTFQKEIVGGNKHSVHRSVIEEKYFDKFNILDKRITSKENYRKIGLLLKGWA